MGIIKVWISFSPWIFFYIIDFFFNLQVTTVWECVFLNTAIMIFNLMCTLNIPYSNQNHHPSKFKFQRHFTILFVVIEVTRKWLWHFFSCDFAIVTGDGNTNYLSVYRFQVLNLNSIEYLRFSNFYWKANRKRVFWHSKTWLDIDCSLVSQ